jgi:lysophospholipase L1-like esterase
MGLVGDSDIARWPISLLPNITTATGTGNIGNHHNSNVLVSGHSGMTLNQILPHVQDTITKLLQCDSSCTNSTDKFVVVCGGENDIGSGIPLNTSKLAFQSLLDLVHTTNVELSKRSRSKQQHLLHLIFLGPKFEPWLRDDNATRKSYIQMSVTFEQLCHQQRKKDVSFCTLNTEYIHYMDCLTMFCGEFTRNQPGALYGGAANAEPIYFHADQLHLSEDGYAIWKSNIEDQISMILSNTGQE